MFAQHPDIARRFVADAKRTHVPAIQAADLDLYRKRVADAYREMTKPAAEKHADVDFASTLAGAGLQAPPQPSPTALTLGGPVMLPVAGGASLPAPTLPSAAAAPPMFDPGKLPGAPPPGAPVDTSALAAVTGTAPNARYVSPNSQGNAALLEAGLTPGAVDPRKVALAPPPNAGAAEAQGGAGYDTSLVAPARYAAIGAHETPNIAPERIAGLNADQQEAIDAQRDLGAADVHAAEDQGVAADLHAKALGGQQQQILSDAAERDAYLKAQEDRIRSLSSEVANARIDPDRWWHSRGVGDQIRFRLASALGGFLSGYRGGPNLALQHINHLVDQDINAQQQAIEAKKGQIGDMQGLLASAYRRFGNMDQAKAAARGVALQQLDAEQQAYAARTGSESAMAKSRLVSAQMKLDADKSMASLYSFRPSQTVQVGGMSAAQQHQIGELAAKIRSEAAANGHDVAPEEARRQAAATLGLTTGTGYASIAKEPKGPGALNQRDAESLRAHDAAISSIDELLKLRAKHNGGTLDPEDNAKAQALAARAQENLVAALGKTNQGLLDRTSHLIPDDPLVMKLSGLVGQDPIGAQLHAAREMLMQEKARYASTPSAEPDASQGPGYDVKPIGADDEE